MNDDAKVVFDSKYPFFGLLTLILLPVCAAILMVFLIAHIKDFPIIASILAVFALMIVIGANAEKIVVETDRFTIITRRLMPVMTTRKTFLFSAIGSIEAHLPLTQREDIEEADQNIVTDHYQAIASTKPYKENSLIVRYKDGVEVQLIPSIYRAVFAAALGHIGQISRIPIVIRDK
jgi:hypothetical protein